VGALPGLLKSNLPGAVLLEAGSVRLVLHERYYFRINSSVLTVVMCIPSNQGEYRLRIVSGGGTAGFLEFTWGTEASANSKVLKLLQAICRESGWEVSSS